MKIVEFRIIVPFTMEQTKISSRYANARKSKEETKGGDGVEILETGEFEEEGRKGVSAHRVYHIKSHVPSALRWALPEKYAHVHEHYKNCFPHYDNYFEIPEMGEDMILKNESRIIPYTHETILPENIMGLNDEELKKRKIVYLDMLNGPSGSFGDYDTHGVSCPEAGIMELHAKNNKCDETKIPQWTEDYTGTMTCIIKVVKFRFKWFGLQSMVEKIVPGVFHDMFLATHRAMIVWAKDWYFMDEQAVTEYENSIKSEVNNSEFDKNDREFTGKMPNKNDQ